MTQTKAPGIHTQWRYIHDDGITHVQSSTVIWASVTTACGHSVKFGEYWETDTSKVVTCLGCIGAR